MIVACALAACMVPPPAPVMPEAPEPWQRLADCESGTWARDGQPIRGTATWDATAGPHQGGLQFAASTWSAFKGPNDPVTADLAPMFRQVAVAERVLEVQGWGAWPVCSRKVGLR